MSSRVAIVGRPNVGKSTLLNRLARRRVSIVHELAGVTRDRVSVEMELAGKSFELIDTGGIGVVDRQDLHPDIHCQIDLAIASASLILFLVDARAGLHAGDEEIADRLRRQQMPVLLLANKCESMSATHDLGSFFKLGLGEPMPLSAEHAQGIDDLIDAITERLPEEERWEDPALKIAIVGRRNAGKSTFINALLQEERVIVSEVPGTTRDAVDVRFRKDGHEFVVIDTAGIVRRAKIKDDIDFYAQVRTLEAVRRSQVVIFLIEASHDIGQLEKRIASEVASNYRACVIGVNKWDLARETVSTAEFEAYMSQMLPGLSYAPVVFLTAKTGKNVIDAVSIAQSLARQSRMRVGTGQMNRALDAIRGGHTPRVKKGQVPKIYYGTQVEVLPPTLVLFVNQPSFFAPTYRRFIENRLRELLPFHEVPIKVVYRQRDSRYHE